jgi:hypothetical protein
MALCAPQCVERSDPIARTEATRGPRRLKGLVMSTQGDGEHPAAGSRRRSLGKKYRTTRLTTVTPPPTRAPRAPFVAATCAPSVPHETVGSMRPCRACPACTSPIFTRCASPPGTACATLRALLCPARAPRGSTRGPRGAGGPSGPWGGTRTCSAGASCAGRGGVPCALSCPPRTCPVCAGGIVRSGGERPQSHKGGCRVCKLCALFGARKSLGSQIFYFFYSAEWEKKKILILSTLFL